MRVGVRVRVRVWVWVRVRVRVRWAASQPVEDGGDRIRADDEDVIWHAEIEIAPRYEGDIEEGDACLGEG